VGKAKTGHKSAYATTLPSKPPSTHGATELGDTTFLGTVMAIGSHFRSCSL
jgi:hypothetical protein